LATDPNQSDALPTLFACYKPVERYHRLLRHTHSVQRPAAVTVSPIDAFLMHQLVALLLDRPQVVDLAADATMGASTALWASHPGVRRILGTVRTGAATDRNGGGNGNGTADEAESWRRLIEMPGELGRDPKRPTTLVRRPEDDAGWQALARSLDPQAPVVFLAEPAVPTLRAALKAVPDALMLLLPLGRVGQDPALGPLLTFCDVAGCRLTALRDVAPFFHDSALALLTRGERPDAAQALERVRRMYDGNFQFLRLAQGLVDAAEREREWSESDGAAGRSRHGAAMPQRAYRQAVERIRRLVGEVVPAGSTVLVVSRGDEELLNLGGRRAWHFPQTDNGVYAGHYPADSAAAIAHLEAVRARGADVLLLPVTAFWWLRHYAEFARHLEENCELLARQDDACILYSLAGTKAVAEPQRVESRPLGRGLMRALRRLLGGADDVAGQ
jgi:hypothetical protein